jgi:hypothetical protein
MKISSPDIPTATAVYIDENSQHDSQVSTITNPPSQTKVNAEPDATPFCRRCNPLECIFGASLSFAAILTVAILELVRELHVPYFRCLLSHGNVPVTSQRLYRLSLFRLFPRLLDFGADRLHSAFIFRIGYRSPGGVMLYHLPPSGWPQGGMRPTSIHSTTLPFVTMGLSSRIIQSSTTPGLYQERIRRPPSSS